MDEVWTPIDELPNYLVSNTGLVMNDSTGRLLKQSLTKQGALKVNIFDGDRSHKTLSVKVLVARGFVYGRDDIFNTAIQLDGNQLNVDASNLMWRPRHYAISYRRQFSNPNPHYEGLYTLMPVMEVESEEVYENIREAGIKFGLLCSEIWKSCVYGNPTSLTGQTFKYVT
jgi:hypothetical protein